MSGASGNPSFNEHEERYFLAEILKASTLPPGALLNFIRDAGIEPAWNDIALPGGRSLKACRWAFEALAARTSSETASRPKKRPYSFHDPASALIRDIQPRPPGLLSASANTSVMVPGPSSPPTADEPVKRKRGRPTKAEHERRVAEAALRGEEYPKARKAKASRWSEGAMEEAETSSEGMGLMPAQRASLPGGHVGSISGPQPPSLPILFTPNTTGPPNTSGSGPTPSKKKKRGNPSDSPTSQQAAMAPYAQLAMG